MRNQKGFTLIELVIVMIILCIAALVIGAAIFVGIITYKHFIANEKAPTAICAEK